MVERLLHCVLGLRHRLAHRVHQAHRQDQMVRSQHQGLGLRPWAGLPGRGARGPAGGARGAGPAAAPPTAR
eukprot:1587534-Lingulodinium_polyedra.AAC.1